MATDSNILAIIPARGGSKGLPRKNLRCVAGEPLVCHAVRHALEAHCISRTIVSTDDVDIAHVAQTAGAEIVRRPEHLSRDDSDTEAAMLHALKALDCPTGYCPDAVVLLQPTSPLRRGADVDAAIRYFISTGRLRDHARS